VSDVGDEQSIERNLSTFSSHVTNLVRVLESSGPAAMVLLDEIATGTDPEEGSVLACALVDALCARGAAVAVTTHYERLKAMALEDGRLANASVGFDVERMEPTFRVRADVPGASSALRVARRFGMPADVIENAQKMLTEESRTFDALVQKLQTRFDELESERKFAASERFAAEQTRLKAAEALAAQRGRDKAKLSEQAEEVLASIREAKDELKEVRRELRRAERHDEESLAKIRERIERAEDKVRVQVEEVRAPEIAEVGSPIAESEITTGLRVYVPRLRAEVDVVEAPSKGRVRVAAGPVKLWVRVDEVRKVGESRSHAKPAALPEPAPRSHVRSDRNTLDVRGMRVDDAIAMAESFLDRMFGSSEAAAYIVHGTGTGALREALREHLLTHGGRYVASLRAGTIDEGGERVTVVSLK
jgi:DNA mismatch repair protein MutS2